MATESFAQARITGEPGKRTYARGGGIPITDVPNLPRQDLSMPVMQYPNIPTIRYNEMKMELPGGEERASKLMQKPLPGGFEEASERVARAAGSGQRAMGKAIEEGSRHLGYVISQTGDTFLKLSREAMNAQDATAEMKADVNRDVLEQQWREGTAGMTNPQDKIKYFEEKIAPQLGGLNSGLGVRPLTRDKIAAQDSGWIARSRAKIGADAQIETVQSNIKYSQAQFDRAIEDGDQERASRAAADEFTMTGDKASLEKRNQQIDHLDKKEFTLAAIEASPEAMETAASAVLRGEDPGKDFEYMKGDKVWASSARDAAQRAKTERWQTGKTTIETELDAGTLKVEDIEKRAQELQMPKDWGKAAYNRATRENPAYDSVKASSLTTDLGNYEPDKIPGELSNMKEYHVLQNRIDELPKNMRSKYQKKLDDAWNRGEDGDTRSATEKQVSRSVSWVDDMDKRGLFGTFEDRGLDEDGKVPKGEGTKEQKQKAAVHAEKILALKDYIEEYARENPEADAMKIREEAEKAARSAFGTTDLPDPPTVTRTEADQKVSEKPKSLEEIYAIRLKRLQGESSAQPNISGAARSQRPTPQWTAAVNAPGESFTMDATGYTPGKGNRRTEGPNAVAAREGPAYTYEQYMAGNVPWVSVAMDSDSPLQGKFLTNPAYPNVRFKVEDTGSAFQGKGNNRIDIAFSEPSKASNFRQQGKWKIVGEQESEAFAGSGSGEAGKVSSSTGANLRDTNPDLLARVDALQQAFGRKLDVISGYRDPAHNKKVGGASGSLHTHGNAVDIDTGSWSIADKRELIAAARRAGIRGIGVYNNNLHFDMGAVRAWGPDHHSGSIPKWAKDIV